MLPLRDLPGVDAIEIATCLSYGDRGDDWPRRARARRVVETVFGIEGGLTSAELPAWTETVLYSDMSDSQRAEVDAINEAWSEHFLICEVSNDDAISLWRELGWDVTDRNGIRMRCLDDFAPAMVCAAKGLRGRTMDELKALIWGAQLSSEAGKAKVAADKDRRYLAFGTSRFRPRGHKRVASRAAPP